MTQAQNLADLSQIAVLSALSHRNYIVDGNFDSWSASSAATPTNGEAYSPAIMYRTSAGGNGVGTISVGTLIGTDPIAMTSPVTNYYLHNQTTANSAGANPYMYQKVENVRTLQGRSSTFSCWLWCTTGTQTITTLVVRQNFGTGGSPSPMNMLDIPVNWVLTTTPQRFSVRLDWPTISGKTLGTNNDHCLWVGLFLPNAAIGYATMQWQLEACPPGAPPQGLPTPFEYRGIQAELARVQRYYNVTGCTVQTALTTVLPQMGYPVTMRGVPVLSATFNNGTGAQFSPMFGSAATMGYYQGIVHSTQASAVVTADARL